jgi:sec-independent protein translocase protein TatB
MELFGVGPLELLVIVVIALLVLGPQDLAKTARSAGRFLNRMYRSEAWKTVTQTSRDLRDLPNRLAREAALEDLDEAIKGGKAPVQLDPEAVNTDSDSEGDLAAWRPSPKGEPSRPRSDQDFGPTPGGLPQSEADDPNDVTSDESDEETSPGEMADAPEDQP